MDMQSVCVISGDFGCKSIDFVTNEELIGALLDFCAEKSLLDELAGTKPLWLESVADCEELPARRYDIPRDKPRWFIDRAYMYHGGRDPAKDLIRFIKSRNLSVTIEQRDLVTPPVVDAPRVEAPRAPAPNTQVQNPPAPNPPAPNRPADGILEKLNRAVKTRVERGESALRIAISDDLLEGLGASWYSEALDSLKERIGKDNSHPQHIYKTLQATSYAAKILWFRTAFEKYRGDNHQSVFAQALGIDLNQGVRDRLRRFGEENPFPFDDQTFKSYVWCLKFEDDGDNTINGIKSFVAQALRVIRGMDIEDALNTDASEYQPFPGDGDVCRHIRALLSRDDSGDFKEFIKILKNRYLCQVLPFWQEMLYQAVRRLYRGFRKEDIESFGSSLCLPRIEKDENNQIILRRPNEDDYDDGDFAEGDAFEFYIDHADTPCGRWVFTGGMFDAGRYPTYQLNRLTRLRCTYANNRKPAKELLDCFLTDEDARIALFAWPQCKLIGRGKSLHVGGHYKLVDFAREPKIIAATDTEEIHDLECLNGVFTVPLNALEVRIGEASFRVFDSVADKLLHGNGRLSFISRSDGRSTAARRFFNRTTYPLFDSQGVAKLTYEYGDCRVDLPIAPEQWMSAEERILNRLDGRLTIRLANGLERRFPVTFVDIDFSAIEQPFGFNESRTVELRVGNQVFPINVAANDECVRLECGGLVFTPPINRAFAEIRLASGRKLQLGKRPDGDRIPIEDVLSYGAKLVFSFPEATNVSLSDGNRIKAIPAEDWPKDFEEIGRKFGVDFSRPATWRIGGEGTGNKVEFTTYDVKSALMPESSRGDERRVKLDFIESTGDLQVTYFSSWKMLDAPVRLSLAVLPTHRQDEKPKLFDLTEKMEVEDPLGKGRCVVSAVVKGFLREELDWGYGLLGFVVASSERDSAVITTGFFIPALYHVEPDLKGDPLAELRLAIASPQVRRDRQMQDDDRDRLAVITREFMTEDTEKRAAIREYLKKAYDVAGSLRFADSVNTFTNTILNADNRRAWVSGYAYMAGWLAQEKIIDGEFRDPMFVGRWSPLLIAYAYQTPRKADESRMTLIKVALYRILERMSQSSEERNTLEKIRLFLESGSVLPRRMGVPVGNGQVIPGKSNAIECTYGVGDGDRFSYWKLFAVLKIFGIALNAWRKNPSLNDVLVELPSVPGFSVQELNEYLLFFDEIDRVVDKDNRFCRKLIEAYATKEYFK